MAESIPLALRVDPPYPGESLTSFLGRAAQFYRTPYKSLVTQLLGGRKLVGKGALDLDLNPPPDLEAALARSVHGWRSPVAAHRGFYGPVVMSRGRYAYCPRCFKEDVEGGRVPYFRIDWAPLFVTTCWKHGSMLMPWHDVNRFGLRLLPKSWLYQQGEKYDAPAFFDEHLKQLDAFEGGTPRVYGGLDPRLVGSKLALLQASIEKRSEAAIPLFPGGRDPNLRLRRLAMEIARVAVGTLWGAGPDQSEQKCLHIEPVSYELVRVPVCLREWPHALNAIRRVADLNWRRTFAWVIAMTLEGTQEFGEKFCPEGRPQPWREWWNEVLISAAGVGQEGRVAQAMQRLAKRLDGLDWPGRNLPTLGVRRTRSSYVFGRKPSENNRMRKSGFAS